MVIMTDDEWQKLYENFETTDLLRTVDAVDKLRDDLNDREYGAPPQIRDDLLKLHQLAMDVVNNGLRDQAGELFELVVDLDMQVDQMMEALEQVQETLSRLMMLYPTEVQFLMPIYLGTEFLGRPDFALVLALYREQRIYQGTSNLEVVYPICCGIDVHKRFLVATIITSDGITPHYQKKRFSTFNNSILQLKTWLLDNNCRDVCMESAGKYWVPVFNLLEDSIHVTVANPKWVKAVKVLISRQGVSAPLFSLVLSNQ